MNDHERDVFMMQLMTFRTYINRTMDKHFILRPWTTNWIRSHVGDIIDTQHNHPQLWERKSWREP